MNDREFAVAGGTIREQAEHLAGVLAEFGVPRVAVTDDGGDKRELSARETDLPGLIVSGRINSLSCAAVGVRITVGAALMGSCEREDVAQRLAAGDGARR